MDISQQKTLVRHSVAERMKRISAKDRQIESRSICRRVVENLPEGPLTICAYYPMVTEPDIVPLMEELLLRGCTLALPRTEGRAFEFRIVQSLNDLKPGPFKILEPTADTELLNLADIQYVLVPGSAFDRSGNRLGRGNGGYDKWIRRLRTMNDVAEIWGLALEFQLVNMIPMEPHDETIDVLVTAREINHPIHNN